METVAIKRLLDELFTFGFLKDHEPAVHSSSLSSLCQHHPCTPVDMHDNRTNKRKMGDCESLQC